MATDVRAKLAEKGLTLPVATKPLAAYVPAVRTGNIVFTAGQLPMVDGAIAKLLMTLRSTTPMEMVVHLGVKIAALTISLLTDLYSIMVLD